MKGNLCWRPIFHFHDCGGGPTVRLGTNFWLETALPARVTKAPVGSLEMSEDRSQHLQPKTGQVNKRINKQFLARKYGYTPVDQHSNGKWTPFEDVFPIENVDNPIAMLVYQRVMFIPLFTGFYTSQVVVWDFWTINSRMESWMIYHQGWTRLTELDAVSILLQVGAHGHRDLSWRQIKFWAHTKKTRFQTLKLIIL